jgi:hypothetical protein
MRTLSLFAVAALALPALAAHAEGIAMKPGLWERTVTTQMPGAPAMPDLPDLSQLPPVVERECVTPEMLKRWEDFAHDDDAGERCTRNVKEQTPKRVVMTMSCEGGRTTGTMEMNAPTPGRMTGSATLVSQREGVAHTTKMKFDSKWLGADCGDVKPRSMPGADER